MQEEYTPPPLPPEPRAWPRILWAQRGKSVFGLPVRLASIACAVSPRGQAGRRGTHGQEDLPLRPAPVEAGSPVPVTLFSDYVCPFCYIGDRRLAKLEEHVDLRVERRFLEIRPETPASGRPVSDLGYPPERWRQMMANLARMARGEGIPLAERQITTNSRRALLLAEAAKDEGDEVFRALNEGIFRAFFSKGKNIGDTSVLRALAADAGVRPETVDRAWRAPVYEERLLESRRAAARLAISGVPAFLVGDRLLVGAVATASLLDAVRGAQARLGA